MRKKYFVTMELIGAFICAVCVCFLDGLYDLSGKNPIGILFGCVNGSIWESLKPLMLSYFLYSGVELLSAKPYFRRFVASKSAGLCVLIALYLTLMSLTDADRFFITLICGLAGFSVSCLLMRWNTEIFFCLGCFLLLLVFMCYFCFTANPPRVPLFSDPATGMYGIIPDNIDKGAFCI